MKYAASKISQTALIAVLYFLGARLGTLLRVPPGIASAIWPAAGIAGAFVFIIGPFATLGITIGALCSAIVNQNGAPWHWFSLVTALAAAGHGALFFQLRRRLIIQNDFDDSESILNFIKIAALSSVGSATIGTAGLHYAGFSTSLTFDWATW
jgi:two-component system, sensor histidine kinase